LQHRTDLNSRGAPIARRQGGFMALRDKYQKIESEASRLGIRNLTINEQAGKLNISGSTTYQLEKDLLWDVIKKQPGWEQEVAADIKVDRSDIHGIHTVQPGDTLSKIAKVHLDDPNRYMEIFNANKDKLKDPNVIQPGQQLVIPNRQAART
jgi:LysM domain